MLKVMRDYASSWLIKFILGAIVVVFVFWGVGSFKSQRATRVAIVNGDVISIQEYSTAYNNLLERYQQQFGNNLTDEMLKMLNIKQQAMNQVIDKKLLTQQAEKLNFHISDDALADYIRNIKAFQNNGVFDNRLYQRVLNQFRMNPEEFELMQKEYLLIDKLRSFITGSVKVSDLEAEEWYNHTNASVDIDYLVFKPDTYKNLDLPDEEIKAYFDAHQTDYQTDPRVKINYVRFNPEAYADKVVVTDEDLQEYYDANPAEFETPKTVEARHILIKVDSDAPADIVNQKETAARDIMKMAREGKDFAELAKQYSEGPSAKSGGYLGAFKKEDMVQPFAEKAFSMQAGEISDPVRTRFGWHVIKVEKVNPAAKLTFEESRPEIRGDLIAKRSKNLAYDDAEAVYDAMFEGSDFVAVAQERSLEMMTAEFSKTGPATGMADPRKFAAAAFALVDPEEFSDILDLADGYYLLQMMERFPEEIPPYDSVKDRVRADLEKEKQAAKALAEAEAMLDTLVQKGGTLAAATGENGLKTASTGFFKRNGAIPQIGYSQELTAAAFSLSAGKPLCDKVIKAAGGYYIIQLKQKKEPAAGAFEKEKDSVKEKLLQQKQLKTFETWLAQIKSESEINIEEAFMN